MATAIGLAMKITADTAGIAKGATQVERLLGNLGKAAGNLDRIFQTNLGSSLSGMSDRLSGFGVTIPRAGLALAAFGAAATAVTAKMLALEDRVENLGNAATQLGVSFGFVQVLENAAARSGTSIDAVAGGIARLQNSLLGVDEESKKAQAALGNIGLTVDELRQLAPEEQYLLLAERITAIEDPARRTATAIALFGKAGKDLLPFFGNIGKAAGDIERLGGALTGFDKARIDQFGDGVDAVTTATSRLFDIVGVTFAGLGEGVAKGLGDAIGGLAAAITPVATALAPLFDLLGVGVQVVGSAIGVVGNFIAFGLSPLSVLGTQASMAIDSLAQAFEDFVEPIQASFGAIAQWLREVPLVGTAYDAMAGVATAAMEQISDATEDARKQAEKLAGQQLAFDLNVIAAQRQNEQAIADADKKAGQEKFDDQLRLFAAERENQQAIEEANKRAAQDEFSRQLDLFRAEQENKLKIEEADKRIAEAQQAYSEQLTANRRRLEAAGNQPLRVNDIRSGGIDEVLRLASGREDPAVEEARRQTAELQRMREDIVKLGGTVEILGAA